MDGRAPLPLLFLFFFSLALQQLSIISHASPASTVRCHAAEREALMEFKRGRLRDPSGRLSSWAGQDCCAWEGVRCNNITGRVIELGLRNRQRLDASADCSDESDWVFDEFGCRWALFGDISQSLISLRHLRHLDLSGNIHQGNPIPEFLGSLTSLTYLNLSRSNLKGKVPDQLGNLSRLHHLDLSFNFHMVDHRTKSPGLYIENAGWISQLPLLRRLNMATVNFTSTSDWLRAMNALPHIEVLRLARCGIVSFPRDSLLHINFTSLSTLDMSGNSMNTSVPNWLLNITSLEELYLGGNNLHWIDFASISKLASLKALELSGNKFQNGFLPAALSKLCKLQILQLKGVPIREKLINLEMVFSRSCLALSLEELGLSSTQLSGSLPDWLESMKNIRSLDLSSNSLYGPLPASLGSLSSLQHLDISKNNLNGTIAQGIFRYMKGLIYLDLTGNSLSLSEVNLAYLPATLEHLDISHNTLLLNDSYEEWIPHFQLKYLSMSYCKMSRPKSQFPKWLQTQTILSGLHLIGIGIRDTFPTWLPTSLVDLALSNNEITGQVPQYLSKLRSLLLSNNSLSGQLPLAINDTMPRMQLLDLSTNNLDGSIPFSICQIKNLFVVRLFKNNFSGKLPNCWKNSSEIILLDLSSNKFQGGIPNSLCNLRQLASLHLDHNNLSGQIPTCLKDCARLVRLDFGYNHLSGNISTWIEDLLNLHVLSLRSNDFEGNISPGLSKLKYLQVLDFSNNKFSGVIPTSFGDLSGFNGYSVSDSIIGYDKMWLFIKGYEFKYENTLLVRSIDLSNNNLSGHIPKELENLNLLISLNLSHNHLWGEIHFNFEEIQQLEVLDLSTNNFSGVIPSSLASLNFLNHLNLSYNNFSGRIPSGSQLQTFEQSSYIGNQNLCGFPLSRSCTNDIAKGDEEDEHEEDSAHKIEIIWLIASIILGFITGFWTICGLLIYKRRWRFAFFRAIDKMHDKFFVITVVVKMAKLRRE